MRFLAFMVIRNFLLLILLIIFSQCRKPEKECALSGVYYINEDAYTHFSPELDSIPLGTEITLTASATREFFDLENNISVYNSSQNIKGPLRIMRLFPTTGAIEEFEFNLYQGEMKKDSLRFSEGLLKTFRTVIWDGSKTDSLHLKIGIKPLRKGIYAINLGQQGGMDNDCAVYKYFLNVGNANKNLHFLSEANNGYISDYESKYVYCFKVN